MSATEWEPFGLSDAESEDYAVLVPGVPAWMRPEITEWIRAFYAYNINWLNTDPLLETQTVLRLDLGVRSGKVLHQWTHLASRFEAMDDQALLRLVDYVLSKGRNANGLRRILDQGRSKWMVGKRFGRTGLVERVPEGVQASVEAVIGSSGDAGRLLARAWSEVHGIEPQDSAAYADALRAVEIAAIKVVQPSHATATLGTVIGQMAADADWRLPWRDRPESATSELILANLRALWVGHRDRHGSPDYSDVTHDEARAAVVLAASLIDWFVSGAVQRRLSEP